MSTDATRCYVCGGEFSAKRIIIKGRAAHQGCAIMSYPPHTADDYSRLHDHMQAEIERLREQLSHAGAAIDQLTKEREEYRMRWLGSPEDMEREIERLRAALKPFAGYADPRHVVPGSMVITNGSTLANGQLTMADCYHARTALEQKVADK